MSKRRNHGHEFNAKVAMDAIRGRKTIREIGADYVPPLKVSQLNWLAAAKRSQRAVHPRKTEHRQVGRTGQGIGAVPADRSAANADGVAQKSLSLSGSRELCKLVDHDYPELSFSRYYELPGHLRSKLYKLFYLCK